MSSRTRWLILAFAVLGLGLSASSSWVHYRLLTDPTYVSPCDINTIFNCTQVYLSRYGSIGGVPVAIGGLIWFGLVALVAGFSEPSRQRSVAVAYLRALAVVGVCVVLYLGYVSSMVLRTGCLLCMGTYVCVVAIFVLSRFAIGEPMSRLPGRLAADLGASLRRPEALIAVILYLAGAASVVAFFPKESTIAEQAASQAASQAAPSTDVQQNFAAAWAKQPRVDLGIPPEGAKVIIVKFNDYECPACGSAEMMYKPVLQKFAASNPGKVKYVVKDWPWNKNCNFNAGQTIPGHEASCDAAAAARMARDRGKYDEMANWLYANQGTTPENVKAAAARIIGVTEFDREYALKLPAIRSDVADGGVLGINSTPTFYMNGVRLPNGMQPTYFELAINIELKRP